MPLASEDFEHERLRTLSKQHDELKVEVDRIGPFRETLAVDRRSLHLGLHVAVFELENHLEESTPHFIFRFHVFNGSLFTVSVGHTIDGFVRYWQRELSRKLSLSNTWRLDDLKRYYYGRLEFYQHLTAEEAEYIKTALNQDSNYFDFEHVKIMIESDGAEPRPLRTGRGITLNGRLV